ncbi:MAG: Gldg family protein, partial [Prevotella sp.]|nr:Gldg family protein [Prevotella sp.]
MKTLIKRELSSLLCSPVALSFLSFFLLAAGLMNWYFQGSYNIMDNGYAGLDKFFRLAAQLFMVTIPALTMRAFAEEKRNKNLDMFRTRPVSIASLYVGKLIAAWAIILLALTATLVYVFSVSALSVPSGNIDMHEIVASYFALSLLGVAFVCLGLFASSLTNNQITSFLLAVLLNFTAFYGFDLIAALFDGGTWQLTISSFGISAHNELMRKGVIRGGDLLTLFNYMAVFSTLAVFVTSLKNRRTYKKLLLALSVIIIVNGICRFIPDFRMDFTTDKRYTISDYSKKLLKQSAEEKTPVRFNVYLDGDMNAAFRHLQDAVKDILADFKAYSHGNITFEFLNPYILGGSRDEVFAKMAGQNMNGIALNETDREGKTSQKIIYPYAQAICGTDTLAINLLKNIAGYTAEENINASIENIEFELIDAIRLLEKKEPEAIAFIEGHGELPRPYVYDAEELLSKYFNVNRGEIGYNTSDLDEFKAVIIAGTTA